MANQLQLRKGSASPIAAATVITNALEAEPFFNTTDGGLYVAKATGSAGFAFIGGGDTIAPNTSSTGAELKPKRWWCFRLYQYSWFFCDDRDLLSGNACCYWWSKYIFRN